MTTLEGMVVRPDAHHYWDYLLELFGCAPAPACAGPDNQAPKEPTPRPDPAPLYAVMVVLVGPDPDTSVCIRALDLPDGSDPMRALVDDWINEGNSF